MAYAAHLGAFGASTAQYANIGVTGAGGVATALAPAAMVPIIGAAVAGVGIALALIFARKGPQQKIASTQIVEDVIKQLQLNLQGYMQGPRTRASQAAALANFDAAWAWLTSPQGCGNPELGDPGKRCISERQPGGRYDLFRDLRDPIANDPQVKDDATAALEQAAAAAQGIPPLAWLGLAVIVGAAIL